MTIIQYDIVYGSLEKRTFELHKLSIETFKSLNEKHMKKS